MSDAYKRSGVDLDAASRVTELVRPFLYDNNDGFAAGRPIPLGVGPGSYLVSSTDGVGTKARTVLRCNPDRVPDLGQDVVASVFNDVVTTGARPWAFLDYIAVPRLEPETVAKIVERISQACGKCGAALMGGETAEMPGHFADENDMSLVGFGLGLLSRQPPDGSGVRAGDALIGLASSGPHANGYSLINRIVETWSPVRLQRNSERRRFLEDVTEPTRLYSPILEKAKGDFTVTGCANITGGGLVANISRIFSPSSRLAVSLDHAVLRKACTPVFDFIRREGNIDDEQMLRVFNMGIGFVVCVRLRGVRQAMEAFVNAGAQPYRIGTVIEQA